MCVCVYWSTKETDRRTDRERRPEAESSVEDSLQNFVLSVNLQKRVMIVLKSFSGLNAHFQVSVVHFSFFFMFFLRRCAVKEM